MLRPIEIAHPNYRIWEETIDAYLRSHDWASQEPCKFQMAVSKPTLEHFVQQYEDLGWNIRLEKIAERTTLCSFQIPADLVLPPPELTSNLSIK